jgi:hypothetical protein
MTARTPLELHLEDLALDRLVDLVHDRAGRGEPLDPEIESGPVALDQRIRQALIQRFGDKDFIGDAADSVLGTLLRRIRAGELGGQGHGGIVAFLASIALDKAFACRSRRGRNLAFYPADSAPSPTELAMGEELDAQRSYLHQLMQYELDTALAEMEPYLESRRHRAISQILFEEAYGGAPRHNQEIADRVGCALRTVERVRQGFRIRWLPRTEEARRCLGARFEQRV